MAKRKPTPREELPPVLAAVNFVMSAGQSVSAPFNAGAGTVEYIIMPDAWTPAYLTMQISFDGTKYYDVFGQDNKEVLLVAVDPGVVLAASFATLKGGIWVRLRSGPRNSPVAQEADRTFTAMLGP